MSQQKTDCLIDNPFSLDGFTIGVPRFPRYSANLKCIFMAFIVSMIIVFGATKRIYTMSWIYVIISTILLYIIFCSIVGCNGMFLPFATNPPMPHLGLDGVSLETDASGN
jgi:hypothetical protein